MFFNSQQTGCDSGFGHKSALRLNARGFTVYATCLDAKGPGAENLMEKAARPNHMHVRRMDVTNDQDIENVYNEIKADCDRGHAEGVCLYGVLNNAGIPRTGHIEWGQFDDHFVRAMEVNALAPVRVMRKFLPLVREAKGRVVNIASTAGRYATLGHAAYSMSKAALISFTETLRREMSIFNVHVVLIAPMFYRTNIINSELIVKGMERMWMQTNKSVREAYGERYFNACKLAIRSILSSPVVAESLDDVINAVDDAFTSPSPNYTYTCASAAWMRLHYWLFSNIYCQEIAEIFSQAYTYIINGILRARPDL